MAPLTIRFTFPAARMYRLRNADSLFSYFSRYGRIVQFSLFKDMSTMEYIGFGRISYSDGDKARAVLGTRTHLIDSLKLPAVVEEEFASLERPDQDLDDYGFSGFPSPPSFSRNTTQASHSPDTPSRP
ncbi:hypothetical protein H4R35_005887 [Dimargaris xerosporica]|nr:hypothetical protein H4R35_005887 [Dimargaris xerosporica]